MLPSRSRTPSLPFSRSDYYLDLKWDCYDIYMEEYPIYGRELCVKWELGENIKHLKKLDTLRPLFDAIVEKTKDEEFAFGVKRRGAAVVPCDLVSYTWSYSRIFINGDVNKNQARPKPCLIFVVIRFWFLFAIGISNELIPVGVVHVGFPPLRETIDFLTFAIEILIAQGNLLILLHPADVCIGRPDGRDTSRL